MFTIKIEAREMLPPLDDLGSSTKYLIDADLVEFIVTIDHDEASRVVWRDSLPHEDFTSRFGVWWEYMGENIQARIKRELKEKGKR